MAKTQILVSPEQFAVTNEQWGGQYRRKYWRGLLLREPSEFMERYKRFTDNKQRGTLNPAQIAEMVAYQEAEESSIEVRTAEMDVTKDITPEMAQSMSSRYSFAYLLQQFLKRHPEIRSVSNVGARVDFYSAYLAPRFPDVRFISVDFQTRLKEHNRLLPQSPNWTFLPGYWHDNMRSGALASDMYFCVSTSVLMNNRELNTFFDVSSAHAKAYAFCEGWWAKPNTLSSRIIPPEDIPEERPYCGGEYANYHHNYIAKLEKRGYQIETSQIVAKELQFHYLQITASRSAR